MYEGNSLLLLNKSTLTNILPNDEKSWRLTFNEGMQSSLTTICEDLYALAINYLRISKINDINFNGIVEIVCDAIFPSQIIIGILLETIVTTLSCHLKCFCKGLSDTAIF